MEIDIIQEEDKLKSRMQYFALVPEAWDGFAIKEKMYPCCWKVIKLEDRNKNNADLIKGPGIYTLLLQPGIASHPLCSYLMYVGQTLDLRRRFTDYLVDEKIHRKRPKMYRLLNIYDGRIWFCFTEVEQDHLDDYEDALMAAYIPPVNDTDRLPATLRRVMGAFV